MSKKRISILGSTGSIGVSSLDVVSRHKDIFDVVALAAGSNIELLAKQIEEFSPRIVSVKSDELRDKLKVICKPSTEIVVGTPGAVLVATADEAELVLSSMVGAVGLEPTYEAIKKGKTIALANKETLVAAGDLMMKAVKENGVTLLPVDSEHSAIFQSLAGHRKEDVSKIVLTASGGPFWNYNDDFSKITVEQALKHPNWSMGAKITIDSATMMNKGLEVVEAHWLFNLPEDKIDVVIHPQSIVHSMVEYIDGSIIAQLGMPDMKTPIAYALGYPERITSGAQPANMAKLQNLTFFEPDDAKFPMLKLAREAIKTGGSAAAVMNAANEVAVAAFLAKKIGFMDIYRVVSSVMEKLPVEQPGSVEEVLNIDQTARREADNFLS
jgi:1-deoxy-D-xylulose-5-phosphate reductoisomerase